MDRNNIFIEALYGFKCTRRNILFGIFTVLVMVGLVIYQFFPLSEMDSAGSVSDLFRVSIDWGARALPSLIAYKTAYCFNIIQLFFVVVFVVNDSRAARLRAMEPLHARPQNNSEMVIGSFLGKLLVFTMVNLIVFAISMLINVVFYPRSFEWSAYLFYWATLTFPTLVYFLGIAYLVTHFVRHQAFSLMVLFAFLGGIVFWGAGWLNGLFDPCARYIPNLFSDFTGHVNLGNYLLQRGFTLLAGIGFLVLSVISYPRIANHLLAVRKSLSAAGAVFLLAGVVALVYHSRHGVVSDNREACKRVYKEHGKYLPARVVRNDLHVKEMENGDISVSSQMTVTNRTSSAIPLVIYLNPGLQVNTFKIDGKVVSFRRDNQALLADKELNPGEEAEVLICYEGGIENDICFLDIDPGTYHSPVVNSLGMYHFGYTPAFCGKGYKLLTPECVWYPVCVPPYGEWGAREVNFSRYALKVEHDPRLMVISQGNTIEERKGETLFTFDHDMPGISLCVGDYRKREITIDSTRLALYCLSDHDYLLEEYDVPEKRLAEKLEHLKRTHLEDGGCVRTSAFNKRMYSGMKNVYDPTQQYPYRWFALLEVPCDFHCFPGVMQLTGERVQGGIVFIPEKAYSIKRYPVEPLPETMVDKETSLLLKSDVEIKLIIEGGSCDVKPLLCGKTTFISSRECPVLHDVFANVARGGYYPQSDSPVEDYPAVDYLNRKSLKDALRDRSLSPDILKSIIRKKSQELHAYLALQVGEERFRQFYIDFLRSNLFKETTAEACYQQFRQTFGFRLDSLVEGWFSADRLPLLEVREARLIKITETDVPYKLYCFKVFNRSDVPCLLQTDDHQGWVIPPREGREIRTRGTVKEFLAGGFMTIPLAQNLPAIMDLVLEEPGYGHVDTATGVFCLDSSVFALGKEEIIVDNEDPGFRVVKAKDFISSLFREEKSRKKYQEFSIEDAWFAVIGQQFYGFPVRSAHWKMVGSGKQKVEWNTSLPEEGKYEVFFYHARRFTGFGPDLSEENPRYYTVFDGKEEHDVVVMCREDEGGDWKSLGVFDFSGIAKVTLSDRGGTGNNVPILVADAMKWVKVKE